MVATNQQVPHTTSSDNATKKHKKTRRGNRRGSKAASSPGKSEIRAPRWADSSWNPKTTVPRAATGTGVFIPGQAAVQEQEPVHSPASLLGPDLLSRVLGLHHTRHVPDPSTTQADLLNTLSPTLSPSTSLPSHHSWPSSQSDSSELLAELTIPPSLIASPNTPAYVLGSNNGQVRAAALCVQFFAALCGRCAFHVAFCRGLVAGRAALATCGDHPIKINTYLPLDTLAVCKRYHCRSSVMFMCLLEDCVPKVTQPYSITMQHCCLVVCLKFFD